MTPAERLRCMSKSVGGAPARKVRPRLVPRHDFDLALDSDPVLVDQVLDDVVQQLLFPVPRPPADDAALLAAERRRNGL